MRVYLEPPSADWALVRIHTALRSYAPASVEWVDTARAAELVVALVVGRRNRIEVGVRGKAYALVQCVVRSSLRPLTADWIDLWRRAKVVWSYYDLPALCAADGIPAPFEFYHAPLGVNPSFSDWHLGRTFTVMTSGRAYLNESVRECILAAKAVGGQVVHLGPRLGRAWDISNLEGLTDQALSAWYSRCQWVSGLRRVEGFELPAAEGLLCGARPVLFDRPHYRQWYDGLAEFIPEESRGPVVDSLVRLFRRGPEPVSASEIDRARTLFAWPTIIHGFWERACA